MFDILQIVHFLKYILKSAFKEITWQFHLEVSKIIAPRLISQPLFPFTKKGCRIFICWRETEFIPQSCCVWFLFFFLFFLFGKMRIREILINSAEEPGFLSTEGEEVLLAKKVTPVLHMNTLTLDALCHVLPPCQVRESACFFMHVKILICSLLASKAGGQW